MQSKLSVRNLENPALVFAALGDQTRLRLISRLCAEGPMSITRLTEEFKITRQAITKHLIMLESAGLVRDNRRGRQRIWELEKKRLDIAKGYLDQISRRWDLSIDRLRKLVED